MTSPAMMSSWGRSYQEKKACVKEKLIYYLNDLALVNRVFMFLFAFGLFGIAGWGVIFAIPYLYTGYDETVTWAIRAFGGFLVFQLIVNWLCIRYVDSSYNPFLHGTIPDGIEMGENIYKVRQYDENRNANRSRKDATTISIDDGNLMYVATEMPVSNYESPKRTAYPYFSWTPCLRCNRPRPPRCHHCPVCNTCVLKRDHHCFITGVCVGYRNLRHFTVFLFWAAVATAFALLHALPYAYYDVFPHARYIDVIFPIAIIRAAFGYIEWKFVLLIILGWFCLVYLIWSITFLQRVQSMIIEGKTTFENDFKMEILDTKGYQGKLRAVYGNYWLLNFIVPLHFVFEPIDDPVIWPDIRA